MTREAIKNEIDIMPDGAFDAFASMFSAFIGYVNSDNKQKSNSSEKLPKQRLNKVPERVTSFSQLIGTLPEISLEEIRDMRLADKEKRLMK
jgi:hypothetical protein